MLSLRYGYPPDIGCPPPFGLLLYVVIERIAVPEIYVA
jgi:hypothetical protein